MKRDKLEQALRDAIPHVFRQSVHGRHEQDRIDADRWMEFFREEIDELLNRYPATASYE